MQANSGPERLTPCRRTSRLFPSSSWFPDTCRPAPLVGGGGGGGDVHETVEAVMDARGEWFPAASNASTVTVWVVPHARPVNARLVAVVVPTAEPSSQTP